MAEDDETQGDAGDQQKSEDRGQQQDQLGEAGKKALEAERRNARAAAKERDALAARLKEYEDRDKSDLEKATGRAAELEGERDAAKSTALETKRENVVLREAVRAGVNAVRLTDSRAFMAEISALDPNSETFAADVLAKVKAAAAADPTLAGTAAPVVRPNRQQGQQSAGKSSSVEAGRELFRETRGKQTTSS